MASKVTQHGRQYRFDWRHLNGKHRFTDPDEAVVSAARAYVESVSDQISQHDEILTERRFLDHVPVKAVAVEVAKRKIRTFGDVADEMIDYKYTVHKITFETEKIYRRYLRDELSTWCGRDIAGFAIEDLERLRARLRGLTKPDGSKRFVESSVSNHLSLALSVFYYAENKRYLTNNPADGFEYERSPRREKRGDRLVERAEFEILRAVAFDDQTRLMLDVLAGTGLRIGELLALTVEHCHLDEANPWIYVQYQIPSNGAFRLIPPKWKSVGRVTIRPELAAALREYIAKTAEDRATAQKLPTGKPARFVFRTAIKGVAWSYSNWKIDRWHPTLRAAYAAGLGEGFLPVDPYDWVTPHDLRHSHGAWLLADGVDINAVSKRLRHKSIQTTVDIYGAVTVDAEAKVMAALRGVC